MLKYSEQQLIEWIKAQIPFHAQLDDGSLEIRIDDYAPVIGCALHAGNQIRAELNPICQLSPEQRIAEESPHTGDLINSLPISLVAHDSRYEYDLNRAPEQAINNERQDEKIWSRPLTSQELNQSLAKHSRFYRIIDSLIKVLGDKHGKILIFDIHSHNGKNNPDSPCFNLTSKQINRCEFSDVVDHWLAQLAQINIDGIEQTRVSENETSQGLGYLAQHCSPISEKCLVLPTEIKKIFCDENSGTLYPLVFQALQEQLKTAMVETISAFLQHCDKPHVANIRNILGNEIDPQTIQIDTKLYKLMKDVDVLQFINPINLQAEKRKFFKSGYSYQPDFRYKPINIDPYMIKQQLYSLPVDIIRDVAIRNLYRRVIEAFADKVDQMASIGLDSFLYNSLRYYGEPDQKDIDNANFLLHAPEWQALDTQPRFNCDEIESAIKEMIDSMQLPSKIIKSNQLIANAMVKRDTVVINTGANIAEMDAKALAHHEVGVHLVTSVNAQSQPLKILQLGLPIYTMTQEGIAILSEMLSGNLNVTRLQTLALRVIAVKSMMTEQNFCKTFALLTEQYGAHPERAFTITARVYRGGGFTKDYLYLQGFKQALNCWQSEKNFNHLLIGKTTFTDLPVLSELIDRGMLNPPKYITPAFANPQKLDPIVSYIACAIQ